MPTSILSSGKTKTLSSTIGPYGAIAISVYCQKCSNLRGSEGPILSMNVMETSLRKPL